MGSKTTHVKKIPDPSKVLQVDSEENKPAAGLQADRVKEILESNKFKELVKKRLKVSLSLTALMLIVYFGFILTIAFYKEILAIKIGEHITLGLPVGIGIIVFAWLLTGIYTRWANRDYDKSVRELRNEILEK
jgi:uncharacterized membrane protein (DUF485 family)